MNLQSIPPRTATNLDKCLKIEGTRSSLNDRRIESQSALAGGTENVKRFVFRSKSGQNDK
jgi:hypothetical protein